MKAISMSILLLMCLVSTAFGAASQPTLLEAALRYGKDNQRLSIDEFLLPWKNADLDNSTSHLDTKAYCYTPFLIVAQDARQTLLDKQLLQHAKSEKLWQDYAGFWIFKVYVRNTAKEQVKQVHAQIDQQDKILFPVQTSFSVAAQASEKAGNLIIGYFYFEETLLDKKAPLRLTVNTPDHVQHYFYFDPGRLR